MYFAIALICGLAPTTPNAVDGCIGLASPVVFRTLEECEFANYMFRSTVEPDLPISAFIVDNQCILVEIDT